MYSQDYFIKYGGLTLNIPGIATLLSLSSLYVMHTAPKIGIGLVDLTFLLLQ